jgi:hypothetical protein
VGDAEQYHLGLTFPSKTSEAETVEARCSASQAYRSADEGFAQCSFCAIPRRSPPLDRRARDLVRLGWSVPHARPVRGCCVTRTQRLGERG